MYENYPEKYKRMIQYVFDWTLLKVLRNNTKHCIAKTTSARKYLKSKKFPEAVVIPVAMETASFQEQPKINYREKLGIPKSYKILLYVGKVEERRMPLFCMNLYKVVKDKHEDCCLVYVGKGPMVEQTKQYAKEKELKDVYFINQIPQGELPSLYEESSLFILPTRYEIFGMVLIEAMYFGTPVITYRAAGPVDVIENGVDSIVMDSFKVYDWAEKIEEFVFEADMCSKMGSRSSNKIRSSYLWPIVAHDYYDEYCRIISE
jgi:glycosyltransferase involved in cell wall biosynthesis